MQASEPRPDPGAALVVVEIDEKVPAVDLARLEEALRAAVADLMVAAGVLGGVVVTAKPSAGIPDERWLRVTVNGRLCRFSEITWRWAYGLVTGLFFAGIESLAARPGEERSEVLVLTALEAVKSNLGTLLGPTQAEIYRASLPEPNLASSATRKRRPDRPFASTWLRPILEAALDLRCSIADRQAVANALVTPPGSPAERVTEQLLSALRPTVVEIILSPKDVQRIPLSMVTEKAKLFEQLRSGLDSELGLSFPPFRFVPDEKMAEGIFAFKIGCLRTLAFRQFGPDQFLVNERPDPIPAGTSARPTNIPASNMEGALVDRQLASRLQADGFTTWDESQYVILALASALRQHAACFVNVDAVNRLLDVSQQESPRVVQLVRECIPIETITAVLRALVASGVPIRRRARIFSRVVEYSSDDGDLVEFVRSGLRHEIRQRFSQGQTVVAYLFDGQTEQILSRELRTALPEADEERILSAIRREMAQLPRNAVTPRLLTVPAARTALSRLVAREFPGVPVISYRDLPPDTNIQPVARISLS